MESRHARSPFPGHLIGSGKRLFKPAGRSPHAPRVMASPLCLIVEDHDLAAGNAVFAQGWSHIAPKLDGGTGLAPTFVAIGATATEAQHFSPAHPAITFYIVWFLELGIIPEACHG